MPEDEIRRSDAGVPRAFPLAPGIPQNSVGNMVVLPYAKSESLEWIKANIDDIAAVVFDRAIWIIAGGLAGLLIAGLAALALGRGLVRPLGAICGVMDGLAKGDLNVEVPFVEHRMYAGDWQQRVNLADCLLNPTSDLTLWAVEAHHPVR